MSTTDQLAARLANIVGATHISSAPADVASYGGLTPEIVVWPGTPAEVAAALKTCSELGAAVGVAGFGTRVARHWPVKGDRLHVALDTRRMTNILDVDELSRTVHSQCGILVRHLEEALHRQGLTLGPFPAEILGSSLGGLLAAPSPIAHSPRVGWLTDACLGLAVAHADGSTIQTRVAPRRATGPDVARLYLGSRGALGVITAATLRVQRLPEEELALAYGFGDLGAAVAGAQRALARGVRPARLTVLDAERAVEELGPSAVGVACLVVLAGPAAVVAEEHQLLDEVLSGATELPHALASRWWTRASTAPPAVRPQRVGVRLLFSRLPDALRAAPTRIKRQPVSRWLGQFNLQGATLWLSAAPLGVGAEAALRGALLDGGLDPLRPSFPSLMEELRARLDPHETLVVMES
jgi:FAD/FMN-containing dehydrogenase